MGEHTPGPWDYVAATEHCGPYVTSDFGSTICDCYVMSRPAEASTANGGRSKPIHFLHEMADPNARLIAAAPDLLAAAASALKFFDALPESHRDGEAAILDLLQAAIAKATGA